MRPPAMLTGVRTRRVRPTTPENTGSKVGTGKDDLRHQRLVSGGARRDPTVHPGVIGRARDSKHPTQEGHGVAGPPRVDEPLVAHKVACAQ